MKGFLDINIQCKECNNFFSDLFSFINHCEKMNFCYRYKTEMKKCYFSTISNDMSFLINLTFKSPTYTSTHYCNNRNIINLFYINNKLDLRMIHSSYFKMSFEVNKFLLNNLKILSFDT